MNPISDFDGLMIGRECALDRGAIPALAHRIALARSDTAVAEGRDPSGNHGLRRVGTTAIVPLTGLITNDPLLAWLAGGTMPDSFVRALREAATDPDIREILVLVNSPGGEVSLMTETAGEMRRLRALKPITSMARTHMLSAAYWLGAQATTVVATPSATVGSIGVFTVHVDQSRLNDRLGVQPTYITSHPRKVESNPDTPLADDARAFIQARVNEVHTAFVKDIATGRGLSVSTVQSTFGDGRAFGAAEALKRRMVDRIATLEELLTPGGSRGSSALRAGAADDSEAIIAALFG